MALSLFEGLSLRTAFLMALSAALSQWTAFLMSDVEDLSLSL